MAALPVFAYSHIDDWIAEALAPIEPAAKAAAEAAAASAPVHTDSAQFVHVMGLPDDTLAALRDAYMCTYDVKVVYVAADLQPSARAVLGDLQVAAVYDAATARGVRVLGIAPAHRRNNKWTVPIVDDPKRVYVGPSKMPLQEASVFFYAEKRKR